MSQTASRRDFLKQSAVGVLAMAGTVSAVAASNERLPIVDTHQHLWDLRKFRLPWLKNEDVQSINRSYLPSDYAEATRGLNIVKSIYMEVNVDPAQHTQEAEYVVDLCKRGDGPMVAAVIGGVPQSPDFEQYISQFAGNPYVKGVRTVLHDPDRPPQLCLDSQFVKSIQRLGELGMRFDLCMRPGEIGDGVTLMQKCPRTQFVVDHCGNMSVTSDDAALRKKWMQAMRAAAAQENSVCKISGIVVTANKGTWKAADLAPNVEFCLETFGEDRVIFGGDWPVCTLKASYAEWLSALQEIVRGRSLESRRKLFSENATRFYGLS